MMGSARWACALLLLLAAQAHADVSIKSVDRKINLKTQIARITDVIEFTSSGGAATSVLLCYPSRLAERIARLRVTAGDAKAEAVHAAAPAGAPDGVSCFSVAVALADGGSVSVEAAASITSVMTPNPAKVAQDEPMLVEYKDTLYAVSPYKIDKQSTMVTLPTANVVKFSPKAKGTQDGGRIAFKKLAAAEPWTLTPLKLHFQHDKQFKKVLTLVREIEVSHWGNIYVEESYILQNAGAEHKGQFSRLRHTHNVVYRATSFQGIIARLPPSAHSLYYKDLIGNISSSNTRRTNKETVVDIALRYPLMGGWKADFVLGYSLPLDGFLFRRPNGRNRLIVDVSSPIDELVIEQLETRVVLPEGSQNIKFTLPFDMDASWDKKYTYLDTVGRPVLVLRKSNVVPLHNKPFAVDYTFTTGALLREPLLLIAVFAALFAAAALFNRLELTIAKDDAWVAARARERAGATLQKIAALWDAESKEVDKISEVTEQLADTEGIETAQGVRQAAEARIRGLDAQAKALYDALEAVSVKEAAGAREHADRGKALQQRAGKLVTEKADHLRKGASASEAAKRIAPAVRALQDARAEWAAAGEALLG